MEKTAQYQDEEGDDIIEWVCSHKGEKVIIKMATINSHGGERQIYIKTNNIEKTYYVYERELYEDDIFEKTTRFTEITIL